MSQRSANSADELVVPLDGIIDELSEMTERIVERLRGHDVLTLEGRTYVAVDVLLSVPLRETVTAVLRHMPSEAAPEHVAAQVEQQVRDWITHLLQIGPKPESGVK